MVPPLLPEIAAELSLTHTQIGIIWGAWFLGMMLFSLVGGAMADRFGVKRVIAGALIFSAIFCALRGFMPDFQGLTVAMFLFGASLAFIVPNITKGIGIWFGRTELGRANGILSISVGVGLVLGNMMGASVLSPLLGGWRPTMWLTGAIAAVLFIVWIAGARERPVEEIAGEGAARQPGIWEGLKRVVRVRDLWFVCLIEFCLVGGFLAFQGFLPTMLVEKGMTAARAGLLLGLTLMSSGVFNVVGPSLSDRLGVRKPFVWPFLLLSGIGVSLVAFFMGGPLIAVLILIAVGVGVAIPLLRTIVLEMEGIGPLHTGSAVGLIFVLNRLGAFILPVVMGVVIDFSHLFWPGFLLLGVLNLVAVRLCLAIKETGLRAKRVS
jgi:MFS family permease